jgi:hypothetical protein
MSGTYVRASAIRWVGDEPFPGLVEVTLTDADSRTWTFIDKAPVFDPAGDLGRSTRYPVEVKLACTVLETGEDRTTISTAQPWGIETVDHRSRFVVRSDQLTVPES